MKNSPSPSSIRATVCFTLPISVIELLAVTASRTDRPRSHIAEEALRRELRRLEQEATT
jgi:predicted transcriptional regulator